MNGSRRQPNDGMRQSSTEQLGQNQGYVLEVPIIFMFRIRTLSLTYMLVYKHTVEGRGKEQELFLSRPVSFGEGSIEEDENTAIQMVSLHVILLINKQKSIQIVNFDEVQTQVTERSERKLSLMQSRTPHASLGRRGCEKCHFQIGWLLSLYIYRIAM